MSYFSTAARRLVSPLISSNFSDTSLPTAAFQPLIPFRNSSLITKKSMLISLISLCSSSRYFATFTKHFYPSETTLSFSSNISEKTRLTLSNIFISTECSYPLSLLTSSRQVQQKEKARFISSVEWCRLDCSHFAKSRSS